MGSSPEFSIDRRIESRIVIHLQLAIELESPRARQRIAPQRVEALGKIKSLFLENGESGAIAFRMAGRSFLPLRLFPRVINLERQNRKPVDDQAGRLGIERRVGVGKLPLPQPIQQRSIQIFGQVIPPLISRVDPALHVGQVGIVCVRRAGFVLDMPEFEVGPMLQCHTRHPVVQIPGMRNFSEESCHISVSRS